MMIEAHAPFIVDKLLEHAGKSENFRSVVKFLANFEPIGYEPHDYGIKQVAHKLDWQSCPPYVLGAVLAIGYSLSIPHDVLLSDELLPTLAAILRANDEQD